MESDGGVVRIRHMAKKKPEPYRDTLGKRDVVKLMMSQKMTVSEICRSIGCTRDELDQHYADLLEKYNPVEHIPDDESRRLVLRCYGLGMSKDDVALRLGISSETLNKYYPQELREAAAVLLDSVGTALVEQAVKGNVQAAQFVLSRKFGWKETSVNELTGKDGVPLPQTATIHVTVGGQPVTEN